MQPQSEKNRKTDRNPKSRKARRRQKEQQMKFLRQNSWLILLAVLVLVALILFICVITGGQEEAQQEPAETQKTSRYEKAYLCADSPSVSYLDENLEPAGTAVRGSEVTYSAENTRKKDGVTYYLTYLDSLKYGYIAETNLTDNPDIRHGLIGPGVYASHGYERSHVDGVENTLRVLKGYLGV